MSAIEMGGTADKATPEDAYTQGFKDGISAGKKRIEELESFMEALAQYPTKAEREILCEKAETYLKEREEREVK